MSDGMGEIAGWSRDNVVGARRPTSWDPGFATVVASHGEIEIVFTSPERRVVRQKYFHLASGGRFRLSAEVKTSGFKGGKACMEVLADGGGGILAGIAVPENTAGEWKKVEQTFAAPADWTGGEPQNNDDRHFIFQIGGAMLGCDVRRAVRVGIRNLALEPIDEIARNGSRQIPARYVAPQPRRIVPIDPLLAKVDAADARMLFYWPGEPECGVAACALSAKVDAGETAAIAKFETNGRALLEFGRLTPGDHTIALSIVDAAGKTLATSRYLFTAIPRPPEGPCGERLNNFVTRLHDAPLADGEVRFFVPEDGWVWMSISGAAESEATGALDGGAEPCVLRRKGEPFNEAQRFLPAGWHTLRVGGAAKGGRLRVHAVKTLVTNVPVLKEEASCFEPKQAFALPFHRHYGSLSTFNVVNGIGFDAPFKAPFAQRGLRFWGNTLGASVWHAARHDRTTLRPRVESAAWKIGMDVIVDESAGIVDDVMEEARKDERVQNSELLWDMRARRLHGGAVNTYYADSSSGAHFRDRKCCTSEISAIVNSGEGRGFVVPESYAPSFADEALSAKWEDYFAHFLASAVDFVPSAKGRVLFWIAPYVDLGRWTSYDSPEVDLKAHYARLVRAFAVRPDFAGLGGLGFGAATSANDDIRRWGYRLVRHYCLEGATDDIAAQYGFKWAPGFVKNCDFAQGLDCWTPAPGEDGGIVAENIPGFGGRQGRQFRVFPSVKTLGDDVAVFVSGATPNRLQQKISGLVPGKYYTLEYYVADYASAKNGLVGEPPPPAMFSARLSGATEVPSLAYRRTSAEGRNYAALTNFRHVFKADGAECTLTFADCDAEGRMFPAGTKQVVNHIVFKPYYLETPDEVRKVVALFKSENKETKEKAK